MTTNDNMLLITMGLTSEGLNSFTITGRDWIKLEKFMSHYDLTSCDETCDSSYYEIARNITPKQREKFVDCYDLKEAKEYIIHLVYGDGCYRHNNPDGLSPKELMEEWLEHKEETDKYNEKEKATKVLEEMEIDKYNPRSVGGKLDFDRRAEEDGIVWRE